VFGYRGYRLVGHNFIPIACLFYKQLTSYHLHIKPAPNMFAFVTSVLQKQTALPMHREGCLLYIITISLFYLNMITVPFLTIGRPL
jgi:hypothetical protein